jgi:hypothetical protein
MDGGDEDTWKLAILYLLLHCTLNSDVVVVEKECGEAGVCWMRFDGGGSHFMPLVSMQVTLIPKFVPSAMTQSLIYYIFLILSVN